MFTFSRSKQSRLELMTCCAESLLRRHREQKWQGYKDTFEPVWQEQETVFHSSSTKEEVSAQNCCQYTGIIQFLYLLFVEDFLLLQVHKYPHKTTFFLLSLFWRLLICAIWSGFEMFASSSMSVIILFLFTLCKKDSPLNRRSRKQALSIISATDGSVYQVFRSFRTVFFIALQIRLSEGVSTRCLLISL